MLTQAMDMTAAQSLTGNAVIAEAIEAIVREVKIAQENITGRRAAKQELKETYAGYLKRVAQTRGKPALYPYVGSGMGNGALVELADGSVKWDMINGIGVHMFGHGDAEMIATALRASISDTVQQGNLQFNLDSIEFSELLLKEAGRSSRLKHCFLTNSGCMANESALKVCYQKHTPANRVLAFRDCFTGRSVTMAQIGDSAAGRVGIPLTTLVDYVPFYDEHAGAASTAAAVAKLEEYAARYPGQYACFVMELVQGEGGFNIAPREFFEALIKVCKANRIAVWFDEVQTFGRTNQMYYFEHLGLGPEADVVTVGKMSQVCGCLFSEEYAPKPGLLSGTFIGGTVEMQVGKRGLERLRDGGYYGNDGRIARLQRVFREHAQRLVEKHPQWFTEVSGTRNGHLGGAKMYGGVGGMMRLTPFGGDKAKVMKLLNVMFEEGVIAFYCGHGPYHVRLLPPVGVMQAEQMQDVFGVIEKSLARTLQET